MRFLVEANCVDWVLVCINNMLLAVVGELHDVLLVNKVAGSAVPV